MNSPSTLRLACAFILFLGPLGLSSQGATMQPRTRPAAAPAASDSYTGHWEGTWKSGQSGHHGRLRCDFARVDARHYRADFTAYWMLFHSRFSVVFETKQDGRTLRFRGEKDLGKVYGGVYHYDGAISSGAFESQYRSAGDHGLFRLRRG